MNQDKYGKKHSGIVGQNASQSSSSQSQSYNWGAPPPIPLIPQVPSTSQSSCSLGQALYEQVVNKDEATWFKEIDSRQQDINKRQGELENRQNTTKEQNRSRLNVQESQPGTSRGNNTNTRSFSDASSHAQASSSRFNTSKGAFHQKEYGSR